MRIDGHFAKSPIPAGQHRSNGRRHDFPQSTSKKKKPGFYFKPTEKTPQSKLCSQLSRVCVSPRPGVARFLFANCTGRGGPRSILPARPSAVRGPAAATVGGIGTFPRPSLWDVGKEAERLNWKAVVCPEARLILDSTRADRQTAPLTDVSMYLRLGICLHLTVLTRALPKCL